MEDEWLVVAKTLGAGKSIRVKCCNKSRTMVVTNGNRGYSGYCFRCGNKPFKSHGVRSISHFKQIEAAAQFQAQKIVKLPDDFKPISETPHSGMLWLLKNGISLYTAGTYGLGFSPEMQRIIMPVYDNSKMHTNLLYIQARAIHDNQQPKYLNQEAAAGGVVFWSHSLNSSEYAVVTEDILSAIKVGGVIQACSTLGTKMTSAKAMKILERYKKVVLWYDDDESGHTGAKKAYRELLLLGAEDVRFIFTSDDPKTLSHDKIKYEVFSRCLT